MDGGHGDAKRREQDRLGIKWGQSGGADLVRLLVAWHLDPTLHGWLKKCLNSPTNHRKGPEHDILKSVLALE